MVTAIPPIEAFARRVLFTFRAQGNQCRLRVGTYKVHKSLPAGRRARLQKCVFIGENGVPLNPARWQIVGKSDF
jgi:hypothetical protein